MTMDVTNKAGDWTNFSGASWRMVLEKAENYGWRPAGTLRPEGRDAEEERVFSCYYMEWDGNYLSNEGQRITVGDAENMAEALYKSLEEGAWNGDGKEISKLIALLNTGEECRLY
jgi:hypothetical protein